MTRRVEAAVDSLETIRARSRLGIAIEAMITTTGRVATLR
jgi:3'-phosphoadenosine 5'-phosphosulfate sulfotransferase